MKGPKSCGHDFNGFPQGESATPAASGIQVSPGTSPPSLPSWRSLVSVAGPLYQSGSSVICSMPSNSSELGKLSHLIIDIQSVWDVGTVTITFPSTCLII